jgi:hypothetical protein
MPRMNDSSHSVDRWTSAKLFRELNKYANLASFGGNLPAEMMTDWKAGRDDGNAIREATRLYRQTYLQPIIDELARRAKVTIVKDKPDTKTIADKIADADMRGGKYLADANEAAERGDHDKAEKLYAKGQYWLDRSNKLRGCGE